MATTEGSIFGGNAPEVAPRVSPLRQRSDGQQ